MRTPDYFDRQNADEDDGTDLLACNHCGATGLYWQRVLARDGKSESSVLFDESNKRKHVCQIGSSDTFGEATE